MLAATVAGCSGADGSSRATSTTAAPTTTGSTTTSEPTPSEQTATATSAPAAPSEPVTLTFSGDVLLHMPVNDRAARYGAETGKAFDFGPMFDPMRPLVKAADLALCHMEVPIAPDGRLTSYPSFGAPSQVMDGLAHGGYDGCSTASNHSLDRGNAGIVRTLEELDRVGLGHAGTARGPWETGARVYPLDAGTTTIELAHLSYAYGFNGYRLPADAPWAANQIDPDRIRADAAAARAAGAELVVVSLHWGTEYQHQPDAFQRSTAEAILPDSEIDLIIGHHAHVVQPIELVHGRYVVWGLGNHLSNQTQAPRRDGLTVTATAAAGWDGRWRVTGIEAIPTWVDIASFEVLPVAAALSNPATPAGLAKELRASYRRTADVINSPTTPGVTVTPLP